MLDFCVSHSAPGGDERGERSLRATGAARPEWQADGRVRNDRVFVGHVWTRRCRAQHAERSCQCSTVCGPGAQLDTQRLWHVSPYILLIILSVWHMSPYTLHITLNIDDAWVPTLYRYPSTSVTCESELHITDNLQCLLHMSPWQTWSSISDTQVPTLYR